MKVLKGCIPLVLCACMTPATADVTYRDSTQFSGSVGLTYGGDTLGELGYTDGTSQKLKAGSLIQLGLGLRVPLQSSTALQLNAIYHLDSVGATNGEMSFERFLFEAIPYKRLNEKFSAGLGLSYNLNPEMSGDFTADYKFDSTVGVIVSGIYHLNERQRMELRYGNVEYTLNKVGGTSVSSGQVEAVDGSHLGFLYHMGFGN